MRENAECPVLRAEAVRRGRGPSSRKEASMAVKHALGPAGRSGGVHQEGRIACRWQETRLNRLGHRLRACKAFSVDDGKTVQACLVEGRALVGVDDGESGAAVAHRKSMGLLAGCEVHRCRAESPEEEAEKDKNGGAAVIEEGRDTLAPGGAGGLQAAGDPCGARPQIRVGEFRRTVGEEMADRIGSFAGSPFDPVTDRSGRRAAASRHRPHSAQ